MHKILSAKIIARLSEIIASFSGNTFMFQLFGNDSVTALIILHLKRVKRKVDLLDAPKHEL